MPIQTHKGSCQCGAVRFEATLDAEKSVTCNCSRCGRLGSILAFTDADGFRLVSGEANLTEYLFNKQVIHHFFCKTCGVQPFSRAPMEDGKTGVAVNLRCVEDLDPDTLQPQHYDGRSI